MNAKTDLMMQEALPMELQQATLNPQQYVETVFKPFENGLALALQSNVTDYDVSTTAGMKVALSCRAMFRDVRVNTEKERKARKEPLLEIGRLLDAKAKELIATIEPHESHHDALIKAEEQRKAAEKAERERIEAERVAALHAEIAAINAYPIRATGQSSDVIAALMVTLEDMPIELDRFAELTGAALQARSQALDSLKMMHEAMLAQEAEQARLKAEREALAAEQERMRIAAEAERQRIAAEQAEQARLLAEQRRLEDEARAAEQAKLNAEMAEFRRQQAAFEAEKQTAIQAATVIDEPLPFDPEPTPELDDEFDVPAAQVQPRTQATMKLGELNELLAPITLTADGLAELGFKPVGIERTAKLYNVSDVSAICAALIKRLTLVGRQQEAA